jgi:hypothetical protein
MVRPAAREPIFDLFPPESAPSTPEAEREGLALLKSLNRAHRAGREGDSRLDARITSYELAARLQISAPEVLDLAGESAATRALYGLDDPVTEDFGRNCLIARRLLEPTTDSPGATVTATRTSPATTATWAEAWTDPPPR